MVVVVVEEEPGQLTQLQEVEEELAQLWSQQHFLHVLFQTLFTY